MNFIRKNITAFVIIISLFGLLGYIGDGSPPHLQEVKQIQQK